jgi:hypothetical protein
MEAPKIPSFIKTKYQFKRFSFQPRYYDEEKEKLKLRKQHIESEIKGSSKIVNDNTIERHARMKLRMEDTWRSKRDSENRKSNFRIAIIVAILVAILLIIKQKLGV